MVSGIKIQMEHKIGSRFSYENRSPILRSKSISVFHFEIEIRFLFSHRDRDPDQKLFRKNRSAIFRSKSDLGFHFEIDPRSKLFPEKPAIVFLIHSKLYFF